MGVFFAPILVNIRRETKMALRSNHYDAAFEAFLREQRTPHVVVDEARRALMQETSLKSMDFIVYSRTRENLLIDVKGRKFPSGGKSGGSTWENWVIEDDVDSLLEWERVFGNNFRALLVFAYYVVEPRYRSELEPIFQFRNREYAFFGISAAEYRRAMRTRSQSWETFSLARGEFRQLRVPILDLL